MRRGDDQRATIGGWTTVDGEDAGKRALHILAQRDGASGALVAEVLRRLR